MGAKLVSLALTRWAPHVPDRAFRVLVRMAVTALDEAQNGQQAGLYFGGRDLLLSCLRAERTGNRESQLRNLRRAVNELIALGAIRRTNKAYAGVNQVYELTLWAAIRIDAQPVDNSAVVADKGDSQSPPVEDSHDPPQGDSQGPERGTPTTPPRNHEEGVEELREEQNPDLRGPVTLAREPGPPQPAKEESPPKCPEPTCAGGVIRIDEPPGIAYCPTCRPNVIPIGRTAA